MIYVVNINDKVYEVEVERGKANIIRTTNAVAPVPVPVSEPAKVETNSTTPQASVATDTVKGEPVKAPMPGTVLDVKVNVGTKVKKGQVVIILEAMKMENEIFAPKDGVVTEILVSKGTNVSTNDIMMAIQ